MTRMGEGGKEGFLIGERLTGLGGGCGRRPRISFIASISDASAGRVHDVIYYTYSSLQGSRHEGRGHAPCVIQFASTITVMTTMIMAAA